MRSITRLLSTAVLAFVAFGLNAAQGQQLDKVTFATNWVAEAEHGGWYQAVADGTFRKYGLDVTILPGGPNINHRLLLPTGKIEFYLSANLLQAFDAIEHNIPTVAVAAMFQKDPQVFLAHPGQGIEKFEDLKKLTLLVSKEGMAGYFQWMKREYGFRDEQVKPYTFNPQPFLVDKRTAMQGYVTSEPFAVEKEGRFKPVIFLLADHGFDTYSTLIETRRDLVEKRPDLVRRFVEASIIGWYNYMYGDNKAANDLIKKHNPEMSDELINYSVVKMREFGIVDSGESLELGIGAMTEGRVASFYDKMVRAGVVKPSTDFRKAFTPQFINRRVGIELRPKN
jgi:NitT/TauT family transport system substrate-binding protein